MTDPQDKLLSASLAIETAVKLIRSEMPAIEAFLVAARNMENWGHSITPTLYRESTRCAVNAVLRPLFTSAALFVHEYDEHAAKSKAALDAVNSTRA